MKCLVRQIELIKGGNVRSAHSLLPYVFQFFLLLLGEKGISLSMRDVVRMASEIVESPHLKPQEALSAFKPFIRYFFVEQVRSFRPVRSVILVLYLFCATIRVSHYFP